MPRTKSAYGVLWSIIILLFASCLQQINENKESDFESLFPGVDMNTQLKFWKAEDVIEPGECITLDLENFSQNRIVFPADYGVGIFVYLENEWTEIKNSAQYVPPGNRQVSPKGPDSPGVIAVTLCPEIDAQSDANMARVVVVSKNPSGDESTVNRAGAFIDVRVVP
jgi:hypothetical protein